MSPNSTPALKGGYEWTGCGGGGVGTGVGYGQKETKLAQNGKKGDGTPTKRKGDETPTKWEKGDGTPTKREKGGLDGGGSEGGQKLEMLRTWQGDSLADMKLLNEKN